MKENGITQDTNTQWHFFKLQKEKEKKKESFKNNASSINFG